MAEIQSIAVSQTQNLSLSKSLSASYERRESVASLQASLGQGASQPSQDGFGGIFDVIDVSDDARQKLLQDRADAEALAAFVQGERPQVLSAPLVIQDGKVQVNALAAQIAEQFSFTETYELSFLQETTLEIETDQGSIEITQSRLVEASFSSTVSLEQSASVGALQASFSV